MATRRERIILDISDNFTGRMAAANAAAHRVYCDLALMTATWEPHDWDDFQ